MSAFGRSPRAPFLEFAAKRQLTWRSPRQVTTAGGLVSAELRVRTCTCSLRWRGAERSIGLFVFFIGVRAGGAAPHPVSRRTAADGGVCDTVLAGKFPTSMDARLAGRAYTVQSAFKFVKLEGVQAAINTGLARS